ncbi:MAG: transposase [Methylocella sp.]
MTDMQEVYLMPDHGHMMISVPPKYAVSQVVGYIKGNSAIHLARADGAGQRNFAGQYFSARGYAIAGRDEKTIRIQTRQKQPVRIDHLKRFRRTAADRRLPS